MVRGANDTRADREVPVELVGAHGEEDWNTRV